MFSGWLNTLSYSFCFNPVLSIATTHYITSDDDYSHCWDCWHHSLLFYFTYCISFSLFDLHLYGTQAEDCLKKEKDRVLNYLHTSSEPKLLEVSFSDIKVAKTWSIWILGLLPPDNDMNMVVAWLVLLIISVSFTASLFDHMVHILYFKCVWAL